MNRQQPLVSVLMNCFNSEKYLKEAIDSVFAQTYENFEIIFWDNASTDQSAAIAKGYDQRLKYFRGETTVPLYAARNLALKKVKGEFIGFLDCDDLWLPTKLEKQVPLFEQTEVGLVYCDTIFFNDQKDLKRFYEDREWAVGDCFNELFINYFLSLETVLVRKTALNSLSYYFDDRFNMIGDCDLFRRLAYSWKLAMVDEPLAKWRVHENSLSWKAPEKFAEETAEVLKVYDEIFPDFKTKYSFARKKLHEEVHVGLAKSKILSGQPQEARKHSQHILHTSKGKILYAASFLPKNLAKNLYQLYLKNNF